MYRQLIYSILASFCTCSLYATSLQDGVEAYINARTHNYFSETRIPAQQEKIDALRSNYPAAYQDLNTLTNQAHMPGSQYANWLAHYLDPIAEWVSSLFGWHNAILDALRPELQSSDAAHRTNVDAYMQAVKKYVYNMHGDASYASRDILVDLLQQIQLTYVFDIPYKRNLFAQLIASLGQDDVQYVIKQLEHDLPQQQAAEKVELFKQLISHFDHINLALQAVATESDETPEQTSSQQEQANTAHNQEASA